ncbi:g6770 [Coccomyxa elongata]
MGVGDSELFYFRHTGAGKLRLTSSNSPSYSSDRQGAWKGGPASRLLAASRSAHQAISRGARSLNHHAEEEHQCMEEETAAS